MPQVFRRKENGIEIQLLQVFAWGFLQRLAKFRKCGQALIAAARIGRQVAAAVCRADLEFWEQVERSILNQVCKRERSLQRMTNDIVKKTISLQPLFFDRSSCGLGMNENQRVQFLGLRPNGVKLLCRQIISVDAGSDGESAHPKVLYSLFHLLDGERGMLQRHCAEAHEAVGMCSAKRADFFVLQLNEFASEVRVCPVPERIDRD